jgi:hypothetical protein
MASVVPLAEVVTEEVDKLSLKEEVPVAEVVFPPNSGFKEKDLLVGTETMTLLDTTGSMEWPSAVDEEGRPFGPPRIDLAKAALKLAVEELTDLDTAGKDEEEGGGVMVTTFAGGHAKVIGDMNPKNFEELWKDNIHPGGSTKIVPGWTTMLMNYIEEFKDKDPKPLKLVTLITDGEAEDLGKFTHILENDHDAYVCVILIGCQYGDQKHQTAIDQFQALSKKNPRVAFSNFTNCTEPALLAKQIIHVNRQAS